MWPIWFSEFGHPQEKLLTFVSGPVVICNPDKSKQVMCLACVNMMWIWNLCRTTIQTPSIYLLSASVRSIWLGLHSGLWLGRLPSILPCCRHGHASLFDVLGGVELVGGVALWGECICTGVGGVSERVVTVSGEEVFFLKFNTFFFYSHALFIRFAT
jgi:hypothetical protein